MQPRELCLLSAMLWPASALQIPSGEGLLPGRPFVKTSDPQDKVGFWIWLPGQGGVSRWGIPHSQLNVGVLRKRWGKSTTLKYTVPIFWELHGKDSGPRPAILYSDN